MAICVDDECMQSTILLWQNCMLASGIASKRMHILSKSFHPPVGHDNPSFLSDITVTKFQGELPQWGR